MTRIIALFAGCSLLLVDCLTAQDTTELPKLVIPTITTDVHVPDAGIARHRSSPKKSSREILAACKIEDQRCSKTEIDGIITYDIIHDQKPLKMVIRPDGTIEMTVVRIFGSDNAEELRAAFPELIMDFNAFPKTTDGDSRVRLNLEIETAYSFANSSDLETKRPDLHRIYDQHTRPPSVTWSK